MLLYLLLAVQDVESGQPSVVQGADGRTYLSWIEKRGRGHALVYTVASEKDAKPVTVAEGTNWFVNWADCPTMAALADGTLAFAWLEKIGKRVYDYGIRIRVGDQVSWLHDDTSETEHGFVSLVPDGDRFHAVWLDGRSGSMSVRTRTIARDGTRGREEILDDRACECCPTSAAIVDGKLVAVWRDSDDGVRDIRMGAKLVHADGWKMPG
jgi:hypothetical protein